MKKVLGGLGCVGLLAFLLVAVAAQADTVVAPRRTVTPIYDASKEITLEGNVASVNKFVPKSLAGGHLFVSTPKGTIDAHLGPFALVSKKGVSVAVGDHVKMVGVMSDFKGVHVFLVRTIQDGEKEYTIRSKHGFPVLMGAVPFAKNSNLVKGGAQ